MGQITHRPSDLGVNESSGFGLHTRPTKPTARIEPTPPPVLPNVGFMSSAESSPNCPGCSEADKLASVLAVGVGVGVGEGDGEGVGVGVGLGVGEGLGLGGGV